MFWVCSVFFCVTFPEPDPNRRELCVFLSRPRKPFATIDRWPEVVALGATTSAVFKYTYDDTILVLEQDIEIDKMVLSERWAGIVSGLIDLCIEADPDYVWITDEIGAPIPPNASVHEAEAAVAAMWSRTSGKRWIADSISVDHFKSWDELITTA